MPRGTRSTRHRAVTQRLRQFLAALATMFRIRPAEVLQNAESKLAEGGGISALARRAAMADDKLNRGEPDRSKINMSEDYEVKYWTERLGTTREELQKVVDRVGNSANAVAKEFGQVA